MIGNRAEYFCDREWSFSFRFDLLIIQVFRLWASSQTFCPRAKGLKSDVMWAYMRSRAISCAARAPLWISLRSQSLSSNLGISNNIERVGG